MRHFSTDPHVLQIINEISIGKRLLLIIHVALIKLKLGNVYSVEITFLPFAV